LTRVSLEILGLLDLLALQAILVTVESKDREGKMDHVDLM